LDSKYFPRKKKSSQLQLDSKKQKMQKCVFVIMKEYIN